MQTEAVPIDVFVANCFLSPRINSIISAWRIEPVRLQAVVIKDFREMGIFFAIPSHYEILFETVICSLKNSKEIHQLVKKAEHEEGLRKRTRHSDV